MSSSETDDSIDELDDSDDDMYDYEYDDTNRLTSLLNSLMSVENLNVSTSIHPVDNTSIIRPAFGASSNASFNTTVSQSIFDDSIRSYIEAPSLFQSSTNLSPYHLSIDRTINQSNPLASDKLFVVNISYTANARELKEFFITLGYEVIKIDLPNNQSQVDHSFFFVIH